MMFGSSNSRNWRRLQAVHPITPESVDLLLLVGPSSPTTENGGPNGHQTIDNKKYDVDQQGRIQEVQAQVGSSLSLSENPP
jgi:hypothetical protein